MALQLNLEKSAEKLRLSLEKAGVTKIPPMELAFNLDVSGSYKDEHESGLTNLLVTRLVPWGLVFDPDKQLDVFTFSSGSGASHHVGMVNADNYQDFVPRNIIGRVPGWCAGTLYAPVLQSNLETFGWLAPEFEAQARPGFLGRLFGGGNTALAQAVPAPSNPRKSLVLFNTDGDNDDRDMAPTENLFARMEREGHGMFVLFLAVSRQRNDFRFLKRLSERYKNVGLVIIPDVAHWVEQDDDAINAQLITPKLTEWLNV